MKYLLLLLLWGYNAGAQGVGALRFDKMPVFVDGMKTETFDASKFIRPIAITEFRLNLDSIKKVNLELYNYWMRLLGNDTIPICQHIYVAVEPDTVLGDMGSGHDALARVGFHDGKEVVCLKCHHVKNQIIDYDWFWRRRPADLRVGYGMDNRPDTLYFDSTKNQMRLKSAGRFWSPVEAKKNK